MIEESKKQTLTALAISCTLVACSLPQPVSQSNSPSSGLNPQQKLVAPIANVPPVNFSTANVTTTIHFPRYMVDAYQAKQAAFSAKRVVPIDKLRLILQNTEVGFKDVREVVPSSERMDISFSNIPEGVYLIFAEGFKQISNQDVKNVIVASNIQVGQHGQYVHVKAGTPANVTLELNGLSEEAFKSAFPEAEETNTLSAPQGVNLSNISSTQARMSWGAVSGVTDYEVVLLKDNTVVLSQTTSQTEFDFQNLLANTAYSVKVKAVQGEQASAFSDTVPFTTLQDTAITVEKPKVSIEVSPSTATVLPGKAKIISYEATVSNPLATQADSFTWQLNGQHLSNTKGGVIPVSQGTHTFSVTVRRGDQETIVINTVTITEEAVANNPPTISYFNVSPTSVTVAPGRTQQVSLQVNASDPEGQTPDIKWYSNNALIRTGSNQNIDLGKGTHVIKAVISDGVNTIERTQTVTINEQAASNNAPSITSFVVSPTSGTVSAGRTQRISLQVNASDPEGQTLDIKWYSNNEHVRTGSNQNIDLGKGTHVIKAVISDGTHTVERTQTVTIYEQSINNPPSVSYFNVSPTSVTVAPGRTQQVSLQVNASDPDGQNLDIKWYSNNALIRTGTNQNIDLAKGTHVLKVVISDGTHTVERTQTVTIYEQSINNPPSVSYFSVSPTSGTVTPGRTQRVSLQVNASDPEGQATDIKWYSNSVYIGSGTNQSIDLGKGTHFIKAVISDGVNTIERTQTVTVFEQSVNYPPDITSFNVSPTSGEVVGGGMVQVNMSASASDASGLQKYEWFSNGTQIFSGQNGSFSLSSGSHVIKVVVTDLTGLTSSREITVNITAKQTNSYSFSSSSADTYEESYNSGGTWPGLLSLEASISGSRVYFTMRKTSGSFQKASQGYLKVGTFESHGQDHLSYPGYVTIPVGSSLASVSDNLDDYSTGWPKQFYFRVTNSDGVAWVGPITIYKR